MTDRVSVFVETPAGCGRRQNRSAHRLAIDEFGRPQPGGENCRLAAGADARHTQIGRLMTAINRELLPRRNLFR